MDKEDIKAEKTEDTNVIVQSVEKTKRVSVTSVITSHEQNKDIKRS